MAEHVKSSIRQVSFACSICSSLSAVHPHLGLWCIQFLCSWQQMYPYIDLSRVRVVRSTRWTCVATLLPSRSCWSTGIQPLQCQWSSLCHLLRSSARLHPVLLLACRGFLSPCVGTPPPAPPSPTGARTLSAQTTRWRCQSTMKCWLRHAPLPIHRKVKIRTFSWLWLLSITAFWLSGNVIFFKDSGTFTELLHVGDGKGQVSSIIKSVGELSIWPLYPTLVESCGD